MGHSFHSSLVRVIFFFGARPPMQKSTAPRSVQLVLVFVAIIISKWLLWGRSIRERVSDHTPFVSFFL